MRDKEIVLANDSLCYNLHCDPTIDKRDNLAYAKTITTITTNYNENKINGLPHCHTYFISSQL